MPAKIETTGILVGDPEPNDNQFSLVVTHLDAGVKPPAFYLTGTFGPDEKDLFLNRTDAEKCKSGMILPANWKALWTFKENNGTFELKLYTFNKSIEGPSLTFTFPNVTSRTRAGKASLGFGTDPDPKKSLQTLSVEKKPPQQPGIIAFYSDPPEGTQNLPGATVTLKWITFGLTDLKLRTPRKTINIGATERDRGSRGVDIGAINERATLEGVGGTNSVREYVDISSLKSEWYEEILKITSGDPAYPADGDLHGKGLELQPTEIVNANDSCLYAIFRHVFKGSERALLFKAANPFARWDLVESGVPGQQGRIPEGFSESPVVYWDDRVWLIGGSQIDPNPGRTSNLVWRLDPKGGENPSWENLGPTLWKERMGHAALIFRNEIWVMGGRDEAGNPLNDIWRLDKTTRVWKCVAEHAEWGPRCLFHPAVWKDQIWLYGGVTEPFSDSVYEDLWVYPESGDKWEKLPMTGIITAQGKPVSSCLQVFRDEVHLFGNFQAMDSTDTSEELKPRAWSLKDRKTKEWVVFDLPANWKKWGGTRTFSYQVVNFMNTFLIAKGLDYRRTINGLKIYVGGNE